MMNSIQNLCQKRKAMLDESLAFFQFLQDSEEEEAWLVERIRLAKSQDVGKDLVSCTMLIKRHEVPAYRNFYKYSLLEMSLNLFIRRFETIFLFIAKTKVCIFCVHSVWILMQAIMVTLTVFQLCKVLIIQLCI